MLRYAGAVRGYVGAMLRESQDADELSQEIVVKLLRGDFAGADPQKGRFRDLLKVAVRNQVRTFETKSTRRAGKDLDLNQFADDGPQDPAWDESWRSTVLSNTWSALDHYQRTHRGSVAHTILRLRIDFPDDDSPQLAERLAQATAKPFNATSMRQQLHRARLRFAELLLEEVSRLVADPTPDRVQEELVNIGLLDYVKDFLPENWNEKGELKGEAE